MSEIIGNDFDIERSEAYSDMEKDLWDILDLVDIAVILAVDHKNHSLVCTLLAELSPKVDAMRKNYTASSFKK